MTGTKVTGVQVGGEGLEAVAQLLPSLETPRPLPPELRDSAKLPFLSQAARRKIKIKQEL